MPGPEARTSSGRSLWRGRREEEAEEEAQSCRSSPDVDAVISCARAVLTTTNRPSGNALPATLTWRTVQSILGGARGMKETERKKREKREKAKMESMAPSFSAGEK